MKPHPFLNGLRPTLHIAHRGGAALAPENTQAAFRMAVDQYGADMIELDVQVTSDGEVVVAHDDTLDRCTDGSGPIADSKMAELEKLDAGYRFTPDGSSFPFRGTGLRIPRLSEVLADIPVRLNVELKPARAGAEDRLASELRRAGALDRVCVGSGDDAVSERLLRVLPEACHFYPQAILTETCTAVLTGGTPPDAPHLVLDMPLYYGELRVVNQTLLDWAAASGRWINVWTIDDIEEMRRLVSEKVGGIMTDRPDRMQKVLSEARR